MSFNLLHAIEGAATGLLSGGPVGAAVGGVAGGLATDPSQAGGGALPLASMPAMPDSVSFSVPNASGAGQSGGQGSAAQPGAGSFVATLADDGGDDA